MKCKTCGKDIGNSFVTCNGDTYCDEDCMCFDVNYYSQNADESDELNSECELSYGCSIKEAMNILINHNKWRRDMHVPNQYEMVNPTDLGKAIDVAIAVLNKHVY